MFWIKLNFLIQNMQIRLNKIEHTYTLSLNQILQLC